VLSEIFRTETCEHWIELLERHDIPVCRVNRLEDILDHPQIAANGLVVEHEDPVRGRLRTLGPLIKMSGTPTASASTWRIPVFAVHSRDDQVQPIGPTEQRIAELKKRGVNAQIVVLSGIQHFETNKFVDGLRQAVPWIRNVWKPKYEIRRK